MMTAETILLIHVALIALSTTAAACGFVKNTNIINAGSYVIEEGDRLLLNCTLPLNAVECFSITDIKCRLEGSRLRVVNRVFVLSQETTQLWIQIVTRNESGGFLCQIPIDNRRNLSRCNNRSFILHGRLDVLRRPLKPVITSCAVRNWTRAQCRWGPTQERQFQHGYFNNWRFLQQSLSLQSHEDSSQWPQVCSNSVNETCDWLLNNNSYHSNDQSSQSSFGRSRCVQVTASNRLLPNKSVKSDQFCFKVEDIVMLDRPTDVSAMVTTSNASLKWFPPFVDPGYKDSLLYKVRYHSEWQDDDFGWLELFSKASHVRLRSLHPNTVYTLNIQSATSVGLVWSQSLNTSFRTSPSVPCSHPKVSSSGFFVRSSNETHRNVTLYWKAVPKSDECGPHLVYKVQINSANAERFSYELQNETSVDVALSNRATFAVRVLAGNDFGFASKSTASIVIIPTLESMMNEEETQEALQATVEGNQSTVTVHWNHRNSFRQVIIFWCQRHADANHLCQDEIHWSDRPSQDGQFKFSLAGHFDSYLIGLAVNSDNIRTSGIHWFKCVYDIEKALDPPLITEVKALVGSTDQLLITWNSSQCYEERYISSYLLLYCMYTNDSCSELRGVNLTSASFQYELAGLDENSRYQVWIESVSYEHGRSRSLPMNARTNAKQFIIEPVLNSGAVGGLVVGCIILTVAGLILLVILLPRSRDSPCLTKIGIRTPPQYCKREFRVDTFESPQSELSNDYDNGDKMTLTATDTSQHQLNYPHSVANDKKQTSQHIKKIRKGTPRSESEDQSECEYWLVGGSDIISKPQHLYNESASVLPVLPNDTGRTLPSSNIPRDSEQLDEVFDVSANCTSTENEVKPMPTNNSNGSSLHISILPKILQKTNSECKGQEGLEENDDVGSHLRSAAMRMMNSESTAINRDSITSNSPRMSHNPCLADAAEAHTRLSKRMHNPLGNKVLRVGAVSRFPNPENHGVSTHEILMPVINPLPENYDVSALEILMPVINHLQVECDFPVSHEGMRSILPPCQQFETIRSLKEVAIAVPQTWADVNSTSDGDYTTGRVIVTNFVVPITEAAAVHQNCSNSTFTSDDGYTSGRVNFTS